MLSNEEKQDALAYARAYGNPQLGYHHQCCNCGGWNTRFMRNTIWLCIDCECDFTLSYPVDEDGNEL